MFRAAGVPAPWIGHARLELNGKDQGFYVVLEPISRDFLCRSFGDPTGNLYKGPGDVDGDLFVAPQSPSKDRADLKAITAAAAEPDRNKRRERMAAVLDLDRFASFLALETMHWHWDGYSMARNNFDIYHDPVSDRLVFFPHHQNQLFGDPGGSIYPHLSGLVAQAFRSTPWGGKLYRERLATLRTELLDLDAVAKRLEELAKKITPVITERISAPEKDEWCGSFRTSVILPAGRYRFGGLMKTKSVEPLREGGDEAHGPSGAALRISGKQPSRKLLGDHDWTWVEFNFEVEATEGEGDSAVGRAELVCELQASRGTVWFDEGSLEVIRVDDQME